VVGRLGVDQENYSAFMPHPSLRLRAALRGISTLLRIVVARVRPDRNEPRKGKCRGAVVGTMSHPGTGAWGDETGIIQRLTCPTIVIEING
jgi:hypothetical protein